MAVTPAARAIYAPLYASGLRDVRSLVWPVSMTGLFMVIAACLL